MSALPFYTLAALASYVATRWYARHSENGSRRVWAAYHNWVKTGRDF
jgi:hypothetical protein